MNLTRFPYAYLCSLLPDDRSRRRFAVIAGSVETPSPRRCYYGALRHDSAAQSW